MKDLQIDITALKAQQAEQIKQVEDTHRQSIIDAEQTNFALTVLINELPQDLKDDLSWLDSISKNSKFCAQAHDADFKIVVKDLPNTKAVDELFQKLNPEPLFVLGAGCTSFVPQSKKHAYLDKDEHAKVKDTADKGYYVRINKGVLPETYAQCYLHIAGLTFEVYVKINERCDDFHIWGKRATFPGDWHYESATLVDNTALFDKKIQWGAHRTKHLPEFTVY